MFRILSYLNFSFYVLVVHLIALYLLENTVLITAHINIIVNSQIFSDIFRAINTTRVLFKYNNIFKYLIYLIFVGIISDLFLLLPYNVQMSIFILLLGIIIEIYDHKKLKIKIFIQWVINNKIYSFTVFILRLLGFYLIITFLVFILPSDIYIFEFYLIPYLQISFVKKLLFFSFLSEVFSAICIPFSIQPMKCDSWDDWDNFVHAHPTVIMPRKYQTLSILAPEVNKNKTVLWYYHKGHWNSYFWNAYHPNDLVVYGLKSFSSPHVLVHAHPLPECEGLYIRVVDRLQNNRITFIPVDTANTSNNSKPLFARNTNGEYILTPFEVQQYIKKIDN